MTLGEKLQRLRKARVLTQEQLAEKLNVSRQSLSKWESDAALPDTANVIALAELFGVTTDYLLREETPQTASAVPDAAEQPAQNVRWRMAPRELGARLMVGIASIGMVVLRVLASFYPVHYGIDGRNYEGFSGFLYGYDLWWALYLLLFVLVAGLLQWFGPWLWQQGRRIWQWMKDTLI